MIVIFLNIVGVCHAFLGCVRQLFDLLRQNCCARKNMSLISPKECDTENPYKQILNAPQTAESAPTRVRLFRRPTHRNSQRLTHIPMYSFKQLFSVTLFLPFFMHSWLFTPSGEDSNEPPVAIVASQKSGNWSDASIWADGQIPTAGVEVRIMAGHTVTYDVAHPKANKIMLAQSLPGNPATLILKADLEVGYLFATKGSSLDIGETEVTAEKVEIGDMGGRAAFSRSEGSRIVADTWIQRSCGSETMHEGDRIAKMLGVLQQNGCSFSLKTVSPLNIRGHVSIGSGLKGTSTLELGEDLYAGSINVFGDAKVKTNKYNVILKGTMRVLPSTLDLLPDVSYQSTISVKDYEHTAGKAALAGGTIVNGTFKMHLNPRGGMRAPEATFTQSAEFGSNTYGVSVESNIFRLISDARRGKAKVTLNWDQTDLELGCDWTFRWKGDRVDAIKMYFSEQQLIAGTLPTGQTFSVDENVFYDEDQHCDKDAYTYVGFKKEPEDLVSSQIRAVPALQYSTSSEPSLTEAATRYNQYGKYLRVDRTLKGVMVFVDFTDLKATEQDSDAHKNTVSNASWKLGKYDLNEFLLKQSFGKATLEMEYISGWKRVNNSFAGSSTTPYVNELGNFNTYAGHLAYVKAALANYPTHDFSKYDMAFIVAPKSKSSDLTSYNEAKITYDEQKGLYDAYEAMSEEEKVAYREQPDAITEEPVHPQYPGINLSPVNTFNENLALTGRIHRAVTFGNDSYSNCFMNAIHEMGHLMGLPDLYPLFPPEGETTVPSYSVMGQWDIMDNIFNGTSFLGWHRNKLEWLDESRMVLLEAGQWIGTLTNLEEHYGTSMVVIPKTVIDGKITAVYVVEQASRAIKGNYTSKECDVRYEDDNLEGDGVLIYTVDANVGTGRFPVKLVNYSETDYKQTAAPYTTAAGNNVYGDDSSDIKVEVLKAHGQAGKNREYTVKITKNTASN